MRQAVKRTKTDGRTGFTLMEVMVSTAISTMVLAALMSCFVWTSKQAHETQARSWGQVESLKSSSGIVGTLRMASAIVDIDGEGNWVEVRFTDGVVSRFTYTNPTQAHGDGYMLFQADVESRETELVIARGLSKVMTTPVRNVFEQTSPNTLRVAYRVTRPLEPVDCASEVDVGVHLRNH